MEQLTLVTSIFTERSWIKNKKGKRITPKFYMMGQDIRKYGNFTYITVSSIGQILFHANQKEILLMEYGSEIEIINFIRVKGKKYLACIQESHCNSNMKYLLYNDNGDFLGEIIGENITLDVWKDEPLSVIKDGKKFIVDALGNVIMRCI